MKIILRDIDKIKETGDHVHVDLLAMREGTLYNVGSVGKEYITEMEDEKHCTVCGTSLLNSFPKTKWIGNLQFEFCGLVCETKFERALETFVAKLKEEQH